MRCALLVLRGCWRRECAVRCSCTGSVGGEGVGCFSGPPCRLWEVGVGGMVVAGQYHGRGSVSAEWRAGGGSAKVSPCLQSLKARHRQRERGQRQPWKGSVHAHAAVPGGVWHILGASAAHGGALGGNEKVRRRSRLA